MPSPTFQHMHISADPSTTINCHSLQWDVRPRCMRKPTNMAHGHIIQLMDGPEHYRTHNCHIKHTKSKQLSDTVQFQHKRITNPSITHTNKVMQALAECIKAIQGMTGKDRNSQVAQDLQRILDTTQARVQTNLHRFEETSTPDYIRKIQQVPRVQTPASTPIPHTNDNR